ncbi:hypothetical protein QUW11_01095 [Mediterranea massiliensis]|uniref:hypothetical protein n=1 Tax=Mediterranea massiliensis TaxID=1841865 RepID=UPI0025A347CB|nr:hypothetical protein [Mediterranea massiliensis]MDM8197148.1 hypothetical protein [Mediterranea massiliensis]
MAFPNGLVTEMVQYSALRCVSGIWQNNEKLLISNGLRSVVTYLLTVALWVLFHCTTHSFSTSHPANRNTFLASYNTNRNNSESTMMTGTRYIISNSSNIYSNLSKAISQTRPFFHFKYTKNQRDMEILQQLFPGKITNCQMNIHYACISRLLHIHSLEDTGDKCRISQNSRLSSAYISGYSSLMNGCKGM